MWRILIHKIGITHAYTIYIIYTHKIKKQSTSTEFWASSFTPKRCITGKNLKRREIVHSDVTMCLSKVSLMARANLNKRADFPTQKLTERLTSSFSRYPSMKAKILCAWQVLRISGMLYFKKKAENEVSLPAGADVSLFQCKSALVTHSPQRLWGGRRCPLLKGLLVWPASTVGSPNLNTWDNSSKRRDPTLGKISRGSELITCFSPEHQIPIYTSITKLLEADKGPSIILGMNLFSELQKQYVVFLILSLLPNLPVF